MTITTIFRQNFSIEMSDGRNDCWVAWYIVCPIYSFFHYIRHSTQHFKGTQASVWAQVTLPTQASALERLPFPGLTNPLNINIRLGRCKRLETSRIALHADFTDAWF